MFHNFLMYCFSVGNSLDRPRPVRSKPMTLFQLDRSGPNSSSTQAIKYLLKFFDFYEKRKKKQIWKKFLNKN